MESFTNELRQRKQLNEKLRIPSLWELIRISINREDWNSRTPYEKWSYLYGIGKICLKPAGFKVYEEDQSITLRQFSMVLLMAVMCLLAEYTITFYILHGDPSKGLPCTCAFSMGASIATFVPSMFTEAREYIHFFTSYSGRYVYNNNKDDTEYNRMCSENIDQSIRRFFIKISMVVFFTAIAQIGPAYEYMKSGTRTTASEMKLPFVDAGSDLEFLGNLILQGLAGCYGTTAYVAIEVYMAIAHDLVCIFPKLMEYDLKGLKTMIRDKSKPKSEVYSTFRNIIKDSLISDDMISCTNELLYLRCLVAPIALTYSIGMSIFCQYQLNYAAGYGLALISWVQMFYLCELSQQLEISNKIYSFVMCLLRFYK